MPVMETALNNPQGSAAILNLLQLVFKSLYIIGIFFSNEVTQFHMLK